MTFSAPSSRVRRLPWALALAALAAALLASFAAPASAHGFSSVVYADVTEGEPGHVRTQLELEYDLLVVSVADYEDDDPFFREATPAWEDRDDDAMLMALADHADSVLAYLDDRFTVTADGRPCTTDLVGDAALGERESVPYAVLTLDHDCGEASTHEFTSKLFPDAEGYVTGTATIVTYELDGTSGSAALGPDQSSFSSGQSIAERFGEFFLLGAEHLLTGIDHILFLLALIAGSRRLREVVLAATAFTLAHSVTFILAATGVVSAPAAIVEPIIALSIAVVAAWHLWQLWRKGKAAEDLDARSGPLGLDRAGWLRLGVVFLFGLVHGVGFAGALGIDEPWSWTLLWSLLVFNLGIEAVQLALIAVVFPLIVLLRRRWPVVGLWATGLLAGGVALVGLVWFVERLLGA
ncbi:HupE/UreJ family protein [Homoserinibacter sp. GY 40078]|uniref:HupE/UreJ family protein n=1 Tax=Homoserinibacter sp. GY 40078 TaxID=2603275 RepID=UPI0011C8581D|nr:HupE/UreJ family protein [Homoserinibacter sp. GY 40078]TXK19238.1 HupE/UreJ family protein [Homoserinibacter sp. GY 40078]